MVKIDWDAIRAYSSPFVLTTLALFALWKDAKDYKSLAREERGTGPKLWLKKAAIPILAIFTILTLVLTVLDIHSTRHQVEQERADAKADKAQIADFKAAIQTGNALLGEQRKDFLKQFSDMSGKVTELQTEVQTSDLKEEASQLRGELESTRKSMEVPKATLSLSFWQDSGQTSSLETLNLENGAIKVEFDVANGSDTDALDGTFVLMGCGECKIIETSPGFIKMTGQPDNERNFDFQHIFANSRTPPFEATITPPPNADSFEIGINYRCRTCMLIRSGQPLPRNDVGTVLIGPHWKSRMLHINRVPLVAK